MCGGDTIARAQRWSECHRAVLLLGAHAADQLHARAHPRRLIQVSGILTWITVW